MVKIRLKRMGRRHRPFYRISAMEAMNPRDGRTLEDLGHYDPVCRDEAKQVVIKDPGRIEYWLGKGAQPTETVKRLLKKQELLPERLNPRSRPTKPSKAEVAAAEEARAAAEAEAAAKAEAEAAAKTEAESAEGAEAPESAEESGEGDEKTEA